MAAPHQKGAVAHDATAHIAKAREIDEQPLLEERGNRVVEVSGLGKLPKPFDDLWRVRGGGEEVWHQAETACHLLPEGLLLGR